MLQGADTIAALRARTGRHRRHLRFQRRQLFLTGLLRAFAAAADQAIGRGQREHGLGRAAIFFDRIFAGAPALAGTLGALLPKIRLTAFTLTLPLGPRIGFSTALAVILAFAFSGALPLAGTFVALLAFAALVVFLSLAGTRLAFALLALALTGLCLGGFGAGAAVLTVVARLTAVAWAVGAAGFSRWVTSVRFRRSLTLTGSGLRLGGRLPVLLARRRWFTARGLLAAGRRLGTAGGTRRHAARLAAR